MPTSHLHIPFQVMADIRAAIPAPKLVTKKSLRSIVLASKTVSSTSEIQKAGQASSV
jgi:hypothetical protein